MATGNIVLLALRSLGCRMYHLDRIEVVAGGSLGALVVRSLCHIHHYIAVGIHGCADLFLGSGTPICSCLGPILQFRVPEVAAGHY